MKYIKPVLFTFVILTVVLCGYIYFRFDSGYALREAYTAYNIGNTQQAQEFLSILNKKSSAKYHLYSGLLMIDEKQYSKALSFFEEAAKINNNPSIQQEIEAALQLCYFLTGDLQNTALLNKSSCSLDYPRQLIKAWSFFKQSRYLEAKEIFEKLPSFEAGHPWLELAYNRYFPKTQIDLMRCHAMIESGEAFNAKQKLEELPQNFKEQSGYYHFLLGLSEIQEAKTRSLNLAIPYYQAAFQQFRKIAFYDPENLSFKSEVDRKSVV